MIPSVLILTLNEEANLPRCLDALAWCDDVVVVDSFSSDKTVDVARTRGARVLQRKFTNFAEQRNFALETVSFRSEWILHLDADEVVTDELRFEIEHLDGAAPVDAYRIAGKLMLDGRWLRHAGMYPVYQVRLTRRGPFRFVQVGHGQRESDGWRTGVLKSGYEHYVFSKGIDDWMERHRRYAKDEALLARTGGGPRLRDLFDGDPVTRRRAAKLLSYRLPLRPFLRFFYVYVVRLGFLDGSVGFRYARLLALYERMIDANVREMS